MLTGLFKIVEKFYQPSKSTSKSDPREIRHETLDKLIDEIKDQFSTHSHFIAQQLALLTSIVIDNRTMKSLLIDKYGENILFTYRTDRSKPLLVSMGYMPLPEIT